LVVLGDLHQGCKCFRLLSDLRKVEASQAPGQDQPPLQSRRRRGKLLEIHPRLQHVFRVRRGDHHRHGPDVELAHEGLVARRRQHLEVVRGRSSGPIEDDGLAPLAGGEDGLEGRAQHSRDAADPRFGFGKVLDRDGQVGLAGLLFDPARALDPAEDRAAPAGGVGGAQSLGGRARALAGGNAAKIDDIGPTALVGGSLRDLLLLIIIPQLLQSRRRDGRRIGKVGPPWCRSRAPRDLGCAALCRGLQGRAGSCRRFAASSRGKALAASSFRCLERRYAGPD